MDDTTNDRVRAFQQLIERDHEQDVAIFQRKADVAAAVGDEEERQYYQGLADRIGALQPPWKQRAG